MANLTLQQMLDKVAMYTRREIGTSPYTGEELDIVNKIKDGINYAYIKICKEKYRLLYSENITLNSDCEFDITDLTKTFFEIDRITYEDIAVKFEFSDDTTVHIPDGLTNATYKVYYNYTPDELSELTDKPIFPEGAIDNTIICNYAAYHFLNIEVDSSAITFLNLFNDGFDKIRQRKGATKQVKTRGRW